MNPATLSDPLDCQNDELDVNNFVPSDSSALPKNNFFVSDSVGLLMNLVNRGGYQH